MIPTTFPALDRLAPPPDPRIERARLVRWLLTAAGFHEAIAFSFIEAEAAGPFAEGADRVDLAYPLSEKFAVMRPSLLAGLLDALAQNRRRGCRDVRLFEIGACYSHQRGEHRRIGLVWTGAAVPGHWTGPGRPVDLFDLKGVVERLLATLRVKARSVAAERSPFVRGRTAELVDGETKLGVVGQVDPSLAERRDLPAADEIFAAELDLDAIGRVADTTEVHFAPLPRFPSVGRDVSVLLDETLTAVTVRETIRGASPATLVSVVEFDRYRGEGIPEGKVSLSFRLTFRSPDRTLTDREVQEAMDAIVGALAREHGAVQR